MAVTRLSNFDRTVQTIADRNAITSPVNGMVVTVVDAIADLNVGAGTASYRWNDKLGTWMLTFKDTYQSMSFDTEELTIANGSVLPSHFPTDNHIWDIQVLDGDAAIAFPRIQDLTISTAGISGLDAYNGYKLRFSYGYGTISQQLNSVLATKADVSYVDKTVATKATTSYVDTAVATKADASYVDTAIATKADVSYVDAVAATKADIHAASVLPDMSSSAGMFLTTDGVKAIWVSAADILAGLPTV
jgi:hypothetical protein